MIMRWFPYALLCSIFLSSADFFVKLASNKISSSMGMLVYGATTFTVGLAWVGYMKIKNNRFSLHSKARCMLLQLGSRSVW